jgi:hypothetical protein
MNQLEFITQSVAAYPDRRVVFDVAIKVKSSPHVALFNCYGAWVGPDGVYLMDYEGEWHGPLKDDQINAGLIISSLYQRLKVMSIPSVVVAQYDCEVNATIFD